jgi:excisionase family DNA binding protein
MLEHSSKIPSVYTIAEIATGLKMSDETIRRKIQKGELRALEIGNGNRKTLRILPKDLVNWIGVANAREIFGIGEGLEELRKAFLVLEPEEREALIAEAFAHARANTPERALTGRELTREEIKERFPNGR